MSRAGKFNFSFNFDNENDKFMDTVLLRRITIFLRVFSLLIKFFSFYFQLSILVISDVLRLIKIEHNRGRRKIINY